MLPPAFPAAPRDTGTGSDRPVPEREKGRGGRSPGASGERPPTGGWVGGRSPTGTSSTSAGDVVQHRLPGAPDLLPVVASSSRLPSLRGAGGQVAPVRDPGTADVPVRVPEGAWSFPRRIRGRPGSASRVCASLEGPRAALEGQSAVGRGENGRAAKSVGGEGAPSGEARRPGGREACENSHDRAAVVDHPGKWATGRRARAERRTASSGRLPWSRVVRSGAGGARIGARGGPSRERAPERRARGPCPSRRWGRSPDRTGHRVAPRPDEPVPGRERPCRGRPAGGNGAFEASTRSYAVDGNCSGSYRSSSPRAGRRRRTSGKKRRGGGRRRGLDRGRAGHLAQHDGAVGERAPVRRFAGRGGPSRREPGQVLAVDAGTPEGEPPGQRTQPGGTAGRGGFRDGSGVGRGGGRESGGEGLAAAPGQVLAVDAGTPEGDPAGQRAQRAGSRRDGRHPGRRRCGCRERADGQGSGGGRLRHRAQRLGAGRAAPPVALGPVDRRTPGPCALGGRDVGTVEDVEQAGERAAGLGAGQGGGGACRGGRRGRFRAHSRLPAGRDRGRGRGRGQGEN